MALTITCQLIRESHTRTSSPSGRATRWRWGPYRLLGRLGAGGQGMSGKSTEYGYRWIVDGRDEGWETSWVAGTDKNRRNPFGPGRHAGVKAGRSVSFTVCEPYS